MFFDQMTDNYCESVLFMWSGFIDLGEKRIFRGCKKKKKKHVQGCRFNKKHVQGV